MKSKLKEIICKNKKNIVLFTIIFIILCLIYGKWFNEHYEIDNYVIDNIGYNNYIQNYFLNSGRIMSSILLKIGDILNISDAKFNLINMAVSIIILSITTVYLKNIIERYKKSQTKFEEIIISLISFVTINNFFTISLMYFTESSILVLSILLFIMAADILIQNKNKAILKSLILLIIGIFSYQGTLSIFIAFALLFSILKNENNTKTIVKDFIKIIILSIICIGINYAVMKLLEQITNNSKIGRLSSITQIPDNINLIITKTGEILFYNLGFFNQGVFITILGLITTLILIHAYIEKKENSFIKRYFFIAIYFIICSTIIFIFTRDSFYTGRMRIVLGTLIGVLFIYTYIETNIFNYSKQNKINKTNKNEKLSKIIYVIIGLILISYLGITVFNYEVNINELIEVNRLDRQNSELILNKIYEYEEKNNTEIKNVYEVLIRYKMNLGYYEGTNMHSAAIKTYDSSSAIICKKLNRKLNKSVIEETKEENIDIFRNNGYIIVEDSLYLPVYVW